MLGGTWSSPPGPHMRLRGRRPRGARHGGGVPIWRPLGNAMTKEYEIRSGRRVVTTRRSVTPLSAVIDYVLTFARRDEIHTIGVDSVAWRGARFTAVLAPVDE